MHVVYKARRVDRLSIIGRRINLTSTNSFSRTARLRHSLGKSENLVDRLLTDEYNK